MANRDSSFFYNNWHCNSDSWKSTCNACQGRQARSPGWQPLINEIFYCFENIVQIRRGVPEIVFDKLPTRKQLRKAEKAAPRDDREERRPPIAKTCENHGVAQKTQRNHVFFGCKPSIPDDSLRYMPVRGFVPSSSAGASTTRHPTFHWFGLNYSNLCVTNLVYLDLNFFESCYYLIDCHICLV